MDDNLIPEYDKNELLNTLPEFDNNTEVQNLFHICNMVNVIIYDIARGIAKETLATYSLCEFKKEYFKLKYDVLSKLGYIPDYQDVLNRILMIEWELNDTAKL